MTIDQRYQQCVGGICHETIRQSERTDFGAREKTCEEVQDAPGGANRNLMRKSGEMTQTEEDATTADLIKDALNHNRIKGLYQLIVGVKARG